MARKEVKKRQGEGEAAHTEQPDLPRLPVEKPRGTTVSTWAIAWFTVVLTIVGAIQTWAFIQTERAQLVIDDINFSDQPLKANKQIPVILEIANSGRTTATINSMAVSVVGALGDIPRYNPAKGRSFSPVIPGSSTINAFLPMKDGKPLAFDDDLIAQIEKGDQSVYVFGFIDYSDPFTPLFGSRLLGFCHVYAPQVMAGIAGPKFLGCDNPNYAYSR